MSENRMNPVSRGSQMQPRRGSAIERMQLAADKRESLEDTPDVINCINRARGVIAEDLKKRFNKEESQIRYLQKEELYGNPLNEPYIKDVKPEEFAALKNIILAYGFKGALEAIEDQNGRYRIIAGGKRHRAISMMTDEEYTTTFPNGIPVQVHPKDIGWTSNQELIHLLITNVFVISGVPDRKQVKDLSDALTREGYTDKEISAFLKNAVSDKDAHSRLMGKIHAISEFQTMCDDGDITETALARLGKMTSEEQKTIYQMFQENNVKNPSAETITQYKQMIKKNTTDQSSQYLNFKSEIGKSKKKINTLEELKISEMSKTELDAAVAELTVLYTSVGKILDSFKKERDVKNS